MFMQTEYKKDRAGKWQGESILSIDVTLAKDSTGSRAGFAPMLHVYTDADSTRASVCWHSPDGTHTTHLVSFAGDPQGDFIRRVMVHPKSRVTEKRIKDLHETALQNLGAIIDAVKAHYAPR